MLDPKNNPPRELAPRENSITISGPLPLASEFAKYEQVLPGSAREILDMAKAQQAHIMALQNKELALKELELNNTAKDNHRVLNLARLDLLLHWLPSIILLLGIFPLIYLEFYKWAGATGIASFIWGFIYIALARKK